MTAFGADVGSFGESEGFSNCPAGGAFFGAWEHSAYPDKGFPPIRKLIFQHAEKGSPSVVMYGFAEVESRTHGLHVQVFHTDCILRIGYLRTQFVEEVLSLVGYVFVEDGYPFPLLFPVLASLLAFGEFSHFPGKFFQTLPVEPGIVRPFSFRGYHQAFHGEVQSENLLGVWFQRSYAVLVFTEDGDVIFPGGALADGYGFDGVLCGDLSMQDQPYPSCLGKTQHIALKPDVSIDAVCGVGLPVLLPGFEPGESSFLGIPEKVFESCFEVKLCVAEGQRVHLLEPDKGMFQVFRGVSKHVACEFVVLQLFFKELVVHEAYTSKGLPQYLLLLPTGANPVTVGSHLLHFRSPPWERMYSWIISMGAPPVVSRQKLLLQNISFQSFSRIWGNSFLRSRLLADL